MKWQRSDVSIICLGSCVSSSLTASFFFSNNEVIIIKADTSSEAKDNFSSKADDSDSTGL